MRTISYFMGLVFLNFFTTIQGQIFAQNFDYQNEIYQNFLSYKSAKPNDGHIYKLLLITGCARSGTTYITEVLRHCGLDILHEAEGQHGIVSWLMATRDYKTPYGPAFYNFCFKHIFHQVRDPLKTMSSLTTENRKAWLFVQKHTPQIKQKDPLIVKCAKYWYYWNKKAEAKAEWTYRVEDIENALEEMGRRIGVHLDKEAIKKVGVTVNHRRRAVEYTWEDVKAALSPQFYAKFIILVRKYGYAVPE
jgi:hypothetical protein